MRRLNTLLRRLGRDQRGTMALETALVTPVLLMLSMGSYETSQVYARQTELQTAVAEAGDVAIAIKVDTDLERTKLRARLKESTGLSDAGVVITNSYRCGAATSTVPSTNSCNGSDVITTYLSISVTDYVDPMWTQFGLGSRINFNVKRTVLVY